jgi:hypothetical protein
LYEKEKLVTMLKILGAAVQNLVALASRWPRFLHPCHTLHKNGKIDNITLIGSIFECKIGRRK